MSAPLSSPPSGSPGPVIESEAAVVIDGFGFGGPHQNGTHVARKGRPGHYVWQDLTYHVGVRGSTNTKKILKGVTGYCCPTQTLAIFGPSGAGKTTLLDLLACRTKAGVYTGELLLDGHEPTQAEVRTCAGYVLQDDVFFGFLTVRETLMYSARLRLPKLTPFDLACRVDEVLAVLGLNAVRDTRIGTAFARGISGGEKKRLSIGVELVTKPHILFLDEPSTGLDSYNALAVMRCLSSLALSGKTVVFSIHQPRSNIFQTFDLILLLTDRGQMAYFGPAKRVVDFLQGGCGLKVDPYVNPADVLLDFVCGAEADGDGALDGMGMGQQMAATYRTSEWATATDKTIHEILSLLRGNEEPRLTSRRTGLWAQFWVVASRALKNNLRNPMKTVVMISVSVFFAFLIGSIYWQVSPNVTPGIQNRAGVLFFLAMNGAFSNLGSLELFLEGRNIFVRERAAGMYSAPAYFLGSVLMDLPLPLTYSVVFSCIAYWMIGLQGTLSCFVWYVITSYLINMCSYALCLCVSCFAPSFAIANLVAPLLIVMFLLPSGFLVNIADLPVYWRWLKYVSFFRYGFEALMINEFKGLELIAVENGRTVPVMGDDILLKNFNFDPSAFGWDIAIIGGQTIVYLAAALGFLMVFQRETR